MAAIRIIILLSMALAAVTGKTFNTNGKEQSERQEQKPLFTFGVIADAQYCNCEPAGTRFYPASLKKLREAVSSFTQDSVQFIVNLGDLIDRDFRSYEPVMGILDSSGKKVYHVAGNHDYSVETRYIRKIPVTGGSKTGYYSFIYEKHRFIVLNGNEISTYSNAGRKQAEEAVAMIEKLRSENAPNAQDWNGAISRQQLSWFEAQVTDAKEKGEQVIVLSHFPVWPENAHNLLNAGDVMAMLKNHDNIIAWFSGHNHAGNYGNSNMIHFVTFKGMVETPESGSFAIVEVYRNKLWIKGGGREKSQILAI